MKTKPEQIKPCPFCGGEASLKRYDCVKFGELRDSFVCKCGTCGASTPPVMSRARFTNFGELIVGTNGADVVIKMWNRRVGGN